MGRGFGGDLADDGADSGAVVRAFGSVQAVLLAKAFNNQPVLRVHGNCSGSCGRHLISVVSKDIIILSLIITNVMNICQCRNSFYFPRNMSGEYTRLVSSEKDFVTWLNEELERRGWSQSELSRRVGVVSSTVSVILAYQKSPGVDFCLGLARALQITPEEVFRRAGLLPPLPAAPDLSLMQQLSDLIKRLPEDERGEVLDYARYRYQRYTRRSQLGDGADR